MKLFINSFLLFILTITVCAQKFPDSETDGKYYEVNGAKIWTVSFGKGDPLFFIAGGPGNAHYYLRSFDSNKGNDPPSLRLRRTGFVEVIYVAVI